MGRERQEWNQQVIESLIPWKFFSLRCWLCFGSSEREWMVWEKKLLVETIQLQKAARRLIVETRFDVSTAEVEEWAALSSALLCLCGSHAEANGKR